MSVSKICEGFQSNLWLKSLELFITVFKGFIRKLMNSINEVSKLPIKFQKLLVKTKSFVMKTFCKRSRNYETFNRVKVYSNWNPVLISSLPQPLMQILCWSFLSVNIIARHTRIEFLPKKVSDRKNNENLRETFWCKSHKNKEEKIVLFTS